MAAQKRARGRPKIGGTKRKKFSPSVDEATIERLEAIKKSTGLSYGSIIDRLVGNEGAIESVLGTPLTDIASPKTPANARTKR